jgi:transposase
MDRLYGRCFRGERCVDYIPRGHWHTNTFIAGLRYDRISAPMLFDGSMNSETFLAYISQVLVPTLSQGDIVICDNLSSHKATGVKENIEACGASIQYLPPYSPDLNPIEMAFSKIKALLKKDAGRSFQDILSSTKNALLSFDSNICTNLFRHANYAT